MRRLPPVALAAVALVAAAPAKDRHAAKSDFSAVTTLAQAKALAAQGKLIPILLFPKEFGGEDIAPNRVFVPPEAAQARGLILGTIERMAREGSVNQLTVEPDYKGDSIIPTRLRLKAWHSGKKGSFQPTVEVR